MLSRLTISNFALIDELSVNFEPGLNMITGETGAGKSIILGALSLILGARADSSSIRDVSKKCIVEGAFNLKGLPLETFFIENDLDYDDNTILRREITPTGKSRAFINDTPVNLQQLRELTLRLVDIHSQHQNLELGNQEFQLKVIDIVAGCENLLKKYRELYFQKLNLNEKLSLLRESAARARADLDYNEFQYKQLTEAALQPGEQEELETERQKLAHAEEIKAALLFAADLLSGERYPVLSQVKEIMNRMGKIAPYMKEAEELYKRLESVYIELQDIDHETGYMAGNMEFDPQRLEEVTQRIDLIYSLQQKHQLSTIEELIKLREELALRISEVSDFDTEILHIEKELERNLQQLKLAATELSEKRKSVFSIVEHSVTKMLKQLGMPHATFAVKHQMRTNFSPTGSDQVQFLFSANKNVMPEEISRIASGGEISRLMLALKTLITGSKMLPTIIFDEIDAGISGEVALKTGAILKELSKETQVINITHLPQIAGMGDHHFKVYKYEGESATFTSIRKLNDAERIEELAVMVGGENPSENARKTAKELLQVN